MCSLSPGGSSSAWSCAGESWFEECPGPAAVQRERGRGTGRAAANAAVAVPEVPTSPCSTFPDKEEKRKNKRGEKMKYKRSEFLPPARDFQRISVESMVPCSHMDGRLPAIISVNRFVSSIFSCSILLLGNVHISMAHTSRGPYPATALQVGTGPCRASRAPPRPLPRPGGSPGVLGGVGCPPCWLLFVPPVFHLENRAGGEGMAWPRPR